VQRDKIEEGIKLVLEGLGADLADHNFSETPRRVADVYEELFTPPETGYPVFDEQYTDMVLMRGHTFYTLCPHHLLPVRLKASVAYIPNGKVIGASKLMRMMHDANRMPMTQEALTAAIQKRIWELTQGTSKGEAVHIQGWHGCFSVRGVRSDANMVTLKYGGEFDTSYLMQVRFLEMLKLS
jgi:GTP cyclohydrolase IA